jgi:hypothetical protein
MSVSGAHRWVAWVMVVVCPGSLLAADGHSAVVHSTGGVWVNGAEVADSTTVFPGDSVETKPGFVANLDTEGSSVLLQPETILKFQGDYVELDHGSVAVGTSTLFSVHVNCIKVEPVLTDRTQYDVTDRSGKVEVAAHKNDVRFRLVGAPNKASSASDSHSSDIVHEGHQDSRDETTTCGAADQPKAASSSPNTKWLEIGGGGGGAAALCLLLCKGKPASNISPSDP